MTTVTHESENVTNGVRP